MGKWIKKVVPIAETTEEGTYFIAKEVGSGGHLFYSRDSKGKLVWSTKPGMALQVHGGPKLAELFAKNVEEALIAIEVPADAEKRWRKGKGLRGI